MMRRRTLLLASAGATLSAHRTLFSGVAAFTQLRTASAQPVRKVHRIGILGLRPTSELAGPEPASPSTKAFLRGMRELGYIYGDEFVTEARGGGGNPEFTALVNELVRLPVDVILAAGPAINAARRATSSIPIVMTASSDPVAEGLVPNLRRPGGNITGFSLQTTETAGKALELLKEVVSDTGTVAIVWNRSGVATFQATESAARERGWKLHSLPLENVAQIDSVFKAPADVHASGVLVYAAAALFPHARRVADLALKMRLPTMFGQGEFVEAGGLMSYGPDIDDIWRRSAIHVDKILKGANPGDLPIEQPTKFKLMINLKTAALLRLTIPQRLLLRADGFVQ